MEDPQLSLGRWMTVATTSRGAEVDALKDHRELGGVDGDLALVPCHGWELERPTFQALRVDRPAVAIEPQSLEESHSTVDEQVEVAVERVSVEALDMAGERIEGPTLMRSCA